MIDLQCTGCGQKFTAPEKLAGRSGKCPKCGAGIKAPEITHIELDMRENIVGKKSAVTANETKWRFDIAAIRNASRRGISRISGKWRAIIVFFVGIGTWLPTMECPPSPLVLVHYIGLVVMVLGLVLWAHRRWAFIPKKTCVIVLSIAVVWLWGRSDSYQHRWVNQFGTRVSDTTMRWSRRVTHRWMWEEANSWTANGPMARDGVPHGEWVTLPSSSMDIEREWYWYGAKVSEGEWHLRNK